MKFINYFGLICVFILLFGASVNAKESLSVVTHKGEGIEEKDDFYIDLLKKIFPNKVISADSMEFKYSMELFLNNKVDAIVAVYPHEVPNALIPNWILDKDAPITAYFHKQKFTYLPQLDDPSLNVGWLHRYGFQEFFNIKNIYEVPNREVGFMMLDKGRLDVFLDYKENNTQRDLRRYISTDVQRGSYLYVAFQNNEKGNRLIKQYDREMLKLSDSGELEKIYGKAFHDSGLKEFKLKIKESLDKY